MAEWRERGYVPDSDDEEEEDVRIRASPLSLNFNRAKAVPDTSNETLRQEQEQFASIPGTHSQPSALSSVTEEHQPQSRIIVEVLDHTLRTQLDDVDSSSRATRDHPSDVRERIEAGEPTAEPASSPVALRLQNTLDLGLRQVGEVLGSRRLNHSPHGPSEILSSPLSSLSSLPDEENDQTGDIELPVSMTGANETLSSKSSQLDEPAIRATFPPRREFRQRNPIQLHPYALEDARYQQELKARGLKPVRVGVTDMHFAQNPTFANRDDTSVFSSSPLETSVPVHTTYGFDDVEYPNEADGQDIAMGGVTLTRNEHDEEELPELSDILRGSRSAALNFPRRTSGRQVAQEGSNLQETNHPSDFYDFSTTRYGHGDALPGSSTFVVPPSPPRSGNALSLPGFETAQREVHQRKSTPGRLSTPLVSSEVHSRKRSLIELSDSSQLSHLSSSSDESASPSDSSIDERAKTRKIREIRRKMKGVLPASWLKLDLKTQATNERVQSVSDKTMVSLDGKGVAQRVNNKRGLSGDVDNKPDSLDSLFDLDVSDVEVGWSDEEDLLPNHNQDRLDYELPEYWHRDNLDNDRVPSMGPSSSHVKDGQPKAAQKKEQHSHETWRKAVKASERSPFSYGRKSIEAVPNARQQGRTKQKHKRQKRKKPASQLTVLSAPGFLSSVAPAAAPPEFLRIAARKARARSTQITLGQAGRTTQDPRLKYFRLANNEDDEDINDTLSQWREGRLDGRQETVNTALFRRSVDAFSSEQDPRTSSGSIDPDGTNTNVVDNLDVLKASSNSTLRRVLFRQQGLTGIAQIQDQPTVSNVGRMAPVMKSHVIIDPRSSLQNRAGRGSLLTIAERPRPAQLEKPKNSQTSSKLLHGLRILNEEQVGNNATSSSLSESRPTLDVIRGRLCLSGVPRSSSRKHVQRIARKQNAPRQHFVFNSSRKVDAAGALPRTTSLKTPALDTEEARLARTAMDAIFEIKPLKNGTKYGELTIIGSGLLSEVLGNKATNAQEAPLQEFNAMDSFGGMTSFAQWSENAASQLISAFEGIQTHIMAMMACTDLDIALDRTMHPHFSQSLISLRRVIEHQYKALIFEELIHREHYVEMSLSAVEKVLCQCKDLRATASPAASFNLHHLVNMLFVYSFQVATIASVPGISHELQNKSWEAFESMAIEGLTYTLREENQEVVQHYMMRNRVAASEQLMIGFDFPEVDTFVLVHHLSYGSKRKDGPTEYFNDLLSRSIEVCDNSVSPLKKLARTVCTLSCMLPILEIDASGRLVEESRKGSKYDGWSLLIPVLDQWLRQYTRSQEARTDTYRRLGESLFAWCLDLASEWFWPVPDILIKKMNDAYANNDMRNLFGKTRAGFRPYVQPIGAIGHPVRDDDDTDFQVFLKLLMIGLTEMVSVAQSKTWPDQKERLEEVGSFVGRLLPNHQEVLRETHILYTEDLVPVGNRCSLYMTLYCCSDDSNRPRIKEIQQLVDFSQSHIAVCRLMLNGWKNLVSFHLGRKGPASDLEPFALWMHDMLKQMIAKYIYAQSEVLAELGAINKLPALPRKLTKEARDTIKANRSSVLSFISEALLEWTHAVEGCSSESHAACLLGGEELDKLIKLCMKWLILDDSVMRRLLQLFEVYSLRDHTDNGLGSLSQIMHRTINQLLSQRLSMKIKNGESRADLLRNLTESYFTLAEVMVARKQMSWDDYLEPAGACSWERFADEEQSARYKVLFISRFFTRVREEYEGRKLWFLQYWITALMRPFQHWQFEHLLTASLLQTDLYTSLLFQLPSIVPNKDNHYDLTLEELMHLRTAILVQVIENIGIEVHRNDSQAELYGFAREELADLITAMTRTMKAGHHELGGDLEARREYDDMIVKMLEIMHRHTHESFPIDPWFMQQDEFQGRQSSVRRRLAGDCSVPLGETLVSKQDVVWFQLTCQKAAVEATQAALLDDLKATYLGDLDDATVDWHFARQLAMMQQVFPVYIELALSDAGGIVALPILQCCQEMCQQMAFRAHHLDVLNYDPILDTLYGAVAAVGACLENAPPPSIWASCIRMSTFSSVLRLARIAILQYRQVLQVSGCHGTSTGLRSVMDYAQYFYSYSSLVGSRPPCHPRGHDPPTRLDVMLENGTVPSLQSLPHSPAHQTKHFARKELFNELTQAWSKDAGGRWWVQRGRDAVPVTANPVAGLEECDTVQMVADEVCEFAAMYLGLQTRLSLSMEVMIM